MSNTFSQFDLHPQLIQTVAERGYEVPTPIQAALIPYMLEGRDVMGQAQTGTGKTAAFALPLLHRLAPDRNSVQGLVLTPTRELAKQVAEAVYIYGRKLDVRVLPIYGGQSYSRQIRRLKKGVDVVVATPGRLLDLIGKREIDLGQVQIAVLDEADEMLSMGFIDDIEAILATTPARRQTAFFSATLPRGIHQLAERHMSNPHSCKVGREDQPMADTIDQRYYAVKHNSRLNALDRLLEVEPITSALVFAKTRASTFKLADALNELGYAAGALNGEMDQSARQKMLERFRSRNIEVLVGTNVAARGLDIDHISHVFNYDLPRDPQVYVHRVGRTGRAGKTGTAISLVPSNQRGLLRKIERYTKQKLTRSDLPTEQDLQAHRDSQLLQHITKRLENGEWSRERELTHRLIEQGYDPMDVAAAALKNTRNSRKHEPTSIDPPEQQNGKRGRRRKKKQSHSRKGGMVQLVLNTGKASGTRPSHVVGSLAHFSGIPGHVIGKIRIQKRQTLVDVPQQFVNQVVAKSGSYKIGKRSVQVSRA